MNILTYVLITKSLNFTELKMEKIHNLKISLFFLKNIFQIKYLEIGKNKIKQQFISFFFQLCTLSPLKLIKLSKKI